MFDIAQSLQFLWEAAYHRSTVVCEPYLSKLCDSLAKSMIGDRRPLALTVEAGAGTAESSAAGILKWFCRRLLWRETPWGRRGACVQVP
jgi:hypothetical protein